MSEKQYCVYLHENKTNEKKYVGITARNPEQRWEHGAGYQLNPHFFNAIKRYGWDGFEHRIIKEGLSEKEAKDLERSLINQYKSNDPKYGYNRSTGGETNEGGVSTRRNPVVCLETGKLYSSYIEAAKDICINRNSIGACVRGKLKTAGGFHWVAFTEYLALSEEERTIQQIDKRVVCLETRVIYDSYRLAAKDLNIRDSSILGCCKHERKSTGGYIFCLLLSMKVKVPKKLNQ